MSDENDDVTTLPRETGSDKSTVTCPSCGGQLPVTTSPYGSTRTGACPKCTTAELQETEKALAQGDDPNAGNPDAGDEDPEPDEKPSRRKGKDA